MPIGGVSGPIDMQVDDLGPCLPGLVVLAIGGYGSANGGTHGAANDGAFTITQLVADHGTDGPADTAAHGSFDFVTVRPGSGSAQAHDDGEGGKSAHQDSPDEARATLAERTGRRRDDRHTGSVSNPQLEPRTPSDWQALGFH
jgi:hypothetical protein